MDINDFFNTLNVDKIDEYIADKQEENLFLDFKTVSDARFSNPDDRRNLAKALSGFANSSGGILVWGVMATKNSEGIDCACGKKEIAPLSLLISKLNEFTAMFVTPAVDGVQHKKLEISGDEGFAATLVPESDMGPHMAKGREDRYYKRSGSSFLRMEHFEVADMFGRRRRPKLSLAVEILPDGVEKGGGEETQYSGIAIIGISNTGRGIAKYPHLSIRVRPRYKIDVVYGLDGNRHDGLPRLIDGGRKSDYINYGANADIVIHPNTVHNVAAVRFKVPESVVVMPNLVIESHIIAEDVAMVTEKKIVPGDEIVDRVKGHLR